MANDLTARPWYIDTASATPIYKSQIKIKFVEVVGGVAGVIGNLMASLTDQNGKSIIDCPYQTAQAGELQTYNLECWYNGLVIPTLAAGVTLRIHVR